MKLALIMSALMFLMACSTSNPPPPPPPAPTVCVGSWSACAGPCGDSLGSQTFSVSVPGDVCEAINGAIRSCTASACQAGHWCVTGLGFSPPAPHSPLLDQPCTVGQSVESDGAMYGCLDNAVACPFGAKAKMARSLGKRPIKK